MRNRVKERLYKVLSVVLCVVLVLQGAPTGALASVLADTVNTSNSALNVLKDLTGNDIAARGYYGLMQRYGLLDADGNVLDSWQIQMDGEDVTLDQIRETLAGDYDGAKTVTVDGTEVTLADLNTMIQIEDYIAYLQDTYFGEQEWTDEQLASLQSLKDQIASTGLNFLGTEGELTFPSGIDHYLRLEVDAEDTAQNNGDYTATVKLANDKTAPVGGISFDYAALSGSVTVEGSGSATIAEGQDSTRVTVKVGEATGRTQGDSAFVLSLYNVRNALFANDGSEGSTMASTVWNKTVTVGQGTDFKYRASIPYTIDYGGDYYFRFLINDTVSRPTDYECGNNKLYGSKDSHKAWSEKVHVPELSKGDYSLTAQMTDVTFSMPEPSDTDKRKDLEWGWKNSKWRDLGSSTASFYLDGASFSPQTLSLSKDIYIDYGGAYRNNGEKSYVQTLKDVNNGKPLKVASKPYVTGKDIELSFEGTVHINDGFNNGFFSGGKEFDKLNQYYRFIPKVNAQAVIDIRETTTAVDATLSVPAGEYYPGQQVPITAHFGFPMQLSEDMYLTVNDQKLTPVEAGATSDTATFLYTVKTLDNASLGVDNAKCDLNGTGANENQITVSLPENEGINKALEGARLNTPAKRSAVGNLTATVENALTNPSLKVTLPVSQDSKLTTWLLAELSEDENKDEEAGIAKTSSLMISVDGETMVPLTAPLEGDVTELTATIPLDLITEGDPKIHVVELYIDGELVMDTYGADEQEPAVFLEEGDLAAQVSVKQKGGSEDYAYADDTHTIYLQDEPQIQASFSITTKDKAFSWGDTTSVTTWTTDENGATVPVDPSAHFAWGTSDATIANIDAAGKVTPTGKAGSVEFTLTALNGGVEVDGVSKRVAKTAAYTFDGAPEGNTSLIFGVGLTPFLMIPNWQLSTMEGQPADVYWTSNLCDKNGEEPTSFAVKVTRGTGKKAEEVYATEVTGTASAPAAKVTVPGEVLTYDYAKSDSNTFTVTVCSTYEGKEYKAAATITLTSKPAKVELAAQPKYYILDTQGSVNLSWTVSNFDRYSADAQGLFELKVTKENGSEVLSQANAGEGEGGVYTGSATLPITDVAATAGEATSYRDVYTVTVKAKNGADATWSYDSFVLYVYDASALQIVVDGVKGVGDTPDALTMSNREEFGSSDVGHGEVNSAEWRTWVTGLKRDINLKNVISANYGTYAWAELADQIAWSSSNNSAATVNYQQGTLYEDITKFTYTSYRPTTDFVLSGLRDGETTVTAEHKLTGMNDSLPVTVETMTDKLYLFQVYPQVETELRFDVYTNEERTETKTVKAKSDEHGAAAYYAEYGIASNVWCTSKSDGNTYLGTYYLSDLKTGERDSTKLELYPCNNLNLRRAAYAYVYLKNPDGTPYAGKVNVRGGVYVNDEYKEKGEFKLQNSSDFVAGNRDNSVKVDADGKLTVTMDQTQWGLDGNAISYGDEVRYVFQIQKGGVDDTEYYPILFKVDGTVNEDAIVDNGEAVVNFRKNERKGKQAFIASQNAWYSNYGTPQSLIGATGYVGPSDSCSEAVVTTDVMWWGDAKPDSLEGAANSLQLVTSEKTKVADGEGESTVTNTSYPFSDMLITSYTVKLNEKSLEGVLAAGTNTGLSLNYYRDGSTLMRSEDMTFRMCNMLGKGKVEDQTEIGNLLERMGKASNTNDPDAKGAMKESKDGFVNTLLNLVASDDYSTDDSLFKIKIAPTSDPTKFLGFITVNVGNMGDDQISGVYAQPDKDENFEYTPGLAEVMLLAGAKSPFEYAFDQMDDYYKAALHRGIRETSFDLGGYCESMIYFDAESGEWEIQVLNGGFNAGGGVSYTWNYNTWCGPVPFTATLTVGGTGEISMDALSVAWESTEGGASRESGLGNDFLTELRLYMYLRFFAGVGFDYSIVAFKLGVFGQVNLDNQFRWLNRPYLEDGGRKNAVDGGEKEVLNGQSFKIDGQVGLEFLMKLLFLSYEKILYSYSFNLLDEQTNSWTQIQKNWDANSAAQKKALGALIANGSASLVNVGGQQMVTLNLAPTIESRDYLAGGGRRWNGGGFQLFSLDSVSGLKDLQTNSYPYANPVVTDDGALVTYLSDLDSTDAEKTHVAWASKSGASYADRGAIFDGTLDDEGYGDSQLSLAGTGNFAVSMWVRQTASVNKDAGATVTDEDQMLMLNSSDVYASVFNGAAWSTVRLSNNGTPDLAPVVATNGKTGVDARAIVAWRSVQSSDERIDTDGGEVLNTTSFDQKDTIVYKTYEGGRWSDEQTLYNGTSGSVKALVASMLDDGTAAVAYTLDTDGADTTTTDREIAYAVVSADAGEDGLREVTRTVRATNDSYLDENPQLTAVTFPGAENQQRFVLGWYAERGVSSDSAAAIDGGTTATTTSEKTADIRLVDFDATGSAGQLLPDSLSQVADSYGVSITSNFRFTKGATSINDLSILWAERAEGNAKQVAGDRDTGTSEENTNLSGLKSESDVLKGVKFYTYGEKQELVRVTGAIDVAKMDEGTLIDHFDSYVSDAEANEVKAVILGTSYGKGGATTTRQVTTTGGNKVEVTTPARESGLYTATETYTDGISVPAVIADYDSVRKGATTQLRFYVNNKGVHAITKLEITVGDQTTTYGDTEQGQDRLNLMPGDNIQLSADYTVPADGVVDPDYVVTATFANGSEVDGGATGSAETGGSAGFFGLFATDGSNVARGTVLLDRPDLSVTDTQIVSEVEGNRTVQVKLNNTADATLAGHNGRTVRLGFYTDSACENPVDDKYLTGAGVKDGMLTIDGASDLAMIDEGGYATQVVFDAAQFAADSEDEDGEGTRCSTEIPGTGIALYVKADVMETDEGEQIVYAEPDMSNNFATVTCDNLAERTGEDVSLTSDLTIDDKSGEAIVDVSLRNNHLSTTTTGNVIVTLLDSNDQVLAEQQSYVVGAGEGEDNGLVTLAGEATDSQTFTFEAGDGLDVAKVADVRVTYTNAKLDQDNANLSRVTVDGVQLSYSESTDDAGVVSGTYIGTAASDVVNPLLTIVAENPDAGVTVNGQAYAQMRHITLVSGENRFKIEVTAPGSTAENPIVRTYWLVITSEIPADEEPEPEPSQPGGNGGSSDQDVSASAGGKKAAGKRRTGKGNASSESAADEATAEKDASSSKDKDGASKDTSSKTKGEAEQNMNAPVVWLLPAAIAVAAVIFLVIYIKRRKDKDQE